MRHYGLPCVHPFFEPAVLEARVVSEDLERLIRAQRLLYKDGELGLFLVYLSATPISTALLNRCLSAIIPFLLPY